MRWATLSDPPRDIPADPPAWQGRDDHLLVRPAVEPGATTRPVPLPDGADRIALWSGRRVAAGETIERDGRPGIAITPVG